MDTNLAIVILAAGQGTRMKSAMPKVLHPLAGVPILGHVLATAQAMDAAHVITVVRHERDRVAALVGTDLPASIVVDQDETPGTGRAVEMAITALPDDFAGEVLVVNGDVPLLDAATLTAFVAAHRDDAASGTVMSFEPSDVTGYGRIVRGEGGGFDRIVEEKDATDAERAITEANAGVYVFGVNELRDQLANVTSANAQGEKYLTDVIALLREAGSEVAAVPVAEPWLVAGINDRAQLSEAALKLNALIVRGWQLAGVTIDDPATTWIDLRAQLAPDVTLKPGTQILGATDVETGAMIGPDTTLVDCEIGAGATVKRTDATLAVIGAGASVGPVRLPARRHPPRRRRQDRHLRRDQERHHRRRQQGAPPLLRGRRDHRRGREHRSRHHRGQLRRRQQEPHGGGLPRANGGSRRVRRPR